MFAIETDLGRFVADDEKGAKKLLAAATKAKAKQDAVDSANCDQAVLYAEHAWYSIVSRKLAGDAFPRGWHFYTALDNYAPADVEHDTTISGKPKPTVTYHGEHGRATFEHYGLSFWGCVGNGAGYIMATFLQEVREAGNGPIVAYAVGVCADQCYLLELPADITIAMFSKDQEAVAEVA